MADDEHHRRLDEAARQIAQSGARYTSTRTELQHAQWRYGFDPSKDPLLNPFPQQQTSISGGYQKPFSEFERQIFAWGLLLFLGYECCQHWGSSDQQVAQRAAAVIDARPPLPTPDERAATSKAQIAAEKAGAHDSSRLPYCREMRWPKARGADAHVSPSLQAAVSNDVVPVRGDIVCGRTLTVKGIQWFESSLIYYLSYTDRLASNVKPTQSAKVYFEARVMEPVDKTPFEHWLTHHQAPATMMRR